VTGVEDLLQDDVYDTIESLKKANIKIWMLTGDKVETAKCISISTGLKSKEQREYVISNDKNINSIGEKINDFKLKGNKDWIFIIDGDALGISLEHFEKLFFETVMCASSVVCCRCSPTQKAQIVKNIRKYSTKRTLSIGDGGNDVPMIQEANLGVGIVGKEGMQASLAADYSITKFCHLKRLLLWYGRISYKNTSNIVIFVIHRGLIISLLQLLFSIIYYFSPIPLYNGFLMLGYSTLYTNIPVLTLLLDTEISNKDVMKFPDLYRELQKGRSLNIKAFLVLFFQSLFQASVIMIGSIYLFNSNLFLNIVTITFSALIILDRP
jgi:phospholipid-translocating ATPase